MDGKIIVQEDGGRLVGSPGVNFFKQVLVEGYSLPREQTIEGGRRYPSGNKPWMVNSCVKRSGADLKVPSMIQLSE